MPIYDVECPYCGAPQDINHDDGYGYEEEKVYEQECGNCHKTFAYQTDIIFFYDVNKADCLNGGEHRWKKKNIFPKYWPDAKRCKDCGLEEWGEGRNNATTR